jgi:predicted enzyme involved in methoxymalonyl-ACP biosynthesis
LIIAEKSPNKWRIDSFLMSCRVIGRGVEETLLAYLIEEAKKEDAVRFIGEFIPTEKNIPSKEFYKKNGFELMKKDGALEIWEYDLKKEYKYPDYLGIIKS